MKKVLYYEADNGQIFDDEQECRQYEIKLRQFFSAFQYHYQFMDTEGNVKRLNYDYDRPLKNIVNEFIKLYINAKLITCDCDWDDSDVAWIREYIQEYLPVKKGVWMYSFGTWEKIWEP